MCHTTTNIWKAFNNNKKNHRILDGRDIFNIECSPKFEENNSTYFAGYLTTLSLKKTFIKLHIIMYILMMVTTVDFEKIQ